MAEAFLRGIFRACLQRPSKIDTHTGTRAHADAQAQVERRTYTDKDKDTGTGAGAGTDTDTDTDTVHGHAPSTCLDRSVYPNPPISNPMTAFNGSGARSAGADAACCLLSLPPPLSLGTYSSCCLVSLFLSLFRCLFLLLPFTSVRGPVHKYPTQPSGLSHIYINTPSNKAPFAAHPTRSPLLPIQ